VVFKSFDFSKKRSFPLANLLMIVTC